jgi:hypothetical protein
MQREVAFWGKRTSPCLLLLLVRFSGVFWPSFLPWQWRRRLPSPSAGSAENSRDMDNWRSRRRVASPTVRCSGSVFWFGVLRGRVTGHQLPPNSLSSGVDSQCRGLETVELLGSVQIRKLVRGVGILTTSVQARILQPRGPCSAWINRQREVEAAQWGVQLGVGQGRRWPGCH